MLIVKRSPHDRLVDIKNVDAEIGELAGDAGDDPDPVDADDRNDGAEILFLFHGVTPLTMVGGVCLAACGEAIIHGNSMQ